MFKVRKAQPLSPVVELYLQEGGHGVELWGQRDGGHILIGRFSDLGFSRSNGLGAACIPVDESGCIKVV